MAASDLPVICSTGGLSMREIDDLVSFLEHRAVDFALMHCVSIYPTPPEKCQLNQIDAMRSRYPDRVIGWSTHEDPDSISPVQIAVAKGARMFERHVGIETETIKLNSYSSTPEKVESWIIAHNKALELCGQVERISDDGEIESLNSLKRGVYAKKILKRANAFSEQMCFLRCLLRTGNLPLASGAKG